MKFNNKYIFIAIIFNSCANIQFPSGGEKDIYPPRIIKTIPENFSVNTSPKKITFYFDEFIQNNNLENKILISPPLNKNEYEIKLKPNEIELVFSSNLKKNTTYNINLNSGIIDYNEGNILENYLYKFSTGKKIDSINFKGKIYPTEKNTLSEKLVIGIYEIIDKKKISINIDSPNYIGIINKKGEFIFNNIKKGIYKLIAFNDINNNFVYDKYSENIAFFDEIINFEDSVYPKIWLFNEFVPFELISKNNGFPLFWVYNQKIEKSNIFCNDERLKIKNKNLSDTICVWPTNYFADSITIFNKIYNNTDSIKFLNVKPNNLDVKPYIISKSEIKITEFEDIKIHFSSPLIKIDSSKIKVFNDSLDINYSLIKNDFNLIFNFNKEEGKDYTIDIPDSSIFTYANTSFEKKTISIKIYNNENLSNLKINLLNCNQNYIIQLINNNKIVRSNFNTNEFKNIPIGKYMLKLIIDENKNMIWDPGDFDKNTLPEKVFFYKNIIELKNNWDNEIDWII